MDSLIIARNGSLIRADRQPFSQMLDLHREKLRLSVQEIFFRSVGRIPSKKENYALSLEKGKIFLLSESKKIPVDLREQVARIRRIVRYYQNIDQIPRYVPALEEQKEKGAQSQKIVNGIYQASLPGANGAMLGGIQITDNSLNVIRNSLLAMGTQDQVADHLGYYSSIFWLFFSLREMHDGKEERARSLQIQDKEGLARAQSRIASGTFVTGGSLAYLASNIGSSLSSSAAIVAASSLSTACFAAGALVATGASMLGAIRCRRFQKRLDEYLDNPHLSEADKLLGALRFLKDGIEYTPEEKQEIVEEIEEKFPSLSLEKKTQLIHQRLQDLTEVKVRYMKRRTSNQSLAMILERSKDLISSLQDPNRRPQAVKEAALLIANIRQENRIKLALYSLGMIASLISLIGMIVFAFLSAGALPFVLNAIAGTVYLVVSIYTMGGVFLKKKEIEAPVMLESGSGLIPNTGVGMTPSLA